MNSEIYVFEKKSGFMQACADAARYASQYICGEVELDKLASMVAKLERKFHLDLPKMQASRLRKNGEATCRLLVYKYPLNFSTLPPVTDEGEVTIPPINTGCFWVIFASEGKHPLGDETREKWRDIKSDRLTFMDFEMCQETRRKYALTPEQIALGKKPNKPKSSPSWTWKFTKEGYSKIRNAFIEAIKSHRDSAVGYGLKNLVQVPGFAGVREQVKSIHKLVSAEWKRHRGNSKMPEIPKVIPYVRRIPYGRVLLKTSIKKAQTAIKNRHEALMSGEHDAPEWGFSEEVLLKGANQIGQDLLD